MDVVDCMIGSGRKSAKPKVIDRRYRVFYSIRTDSLYAIRTKGSLASAVSKDPMWAFIGFL